MNGVAGFLGLSGEGLGFNGKVHGAAAVLVAALTGATVAPMVLVCGEIMVALLMCSFLRPQANKKACFFRLQLHMVTMLVCSFFCS